MTFRLQRIKISWKLQLLEYLRTLSLKGEMHKRPISKFDCTFSAFLVFKFFSFGPTWKLLKKSSVSSDLKVSFKQPRKKKHLLRVSLKTVENWRNGSQMCLCLCFLCISPFKCYTTIVNQIKRKTFQKLNQIWINNPKFQHSKGTIEQRSERDIYYFKYLFLILFKFRILWSFGALKDTC